MKVKTLKKVEIELTKEEKENLSETMRILENILEEMDSFGINNIKLSYSFIGDEDLRAISEDLEILKSLDSIYLEENS